MSENKTPKQITVGLMFLVTEGILHCFVCNFRGYMVFKSRDEAQQSVQENRYVIIDGQKVTQVLAGKTVSGVCRIDHFSYQRKIMMVYRCICFRVIVVNNSKYQDMMK